MGNTLIRLIKICFLISLAGCTSEVNEMKYPETKKEDIQDYIFGKTIEDPYRWLEDFTSEEATEWVERQNNLTDIYLENEYQKKIKHDLEDIWITEDISITFRRGDKTFYYYDDVKQQQSVFMMKECNN